MTDKGLAPTPNQVARRIFAGLPRRYETLAELLGLGQYRRWRRALSDAVTAARPSVVLDVATGPGGVALEIEARTGADVTGLDLTEAMLRHATTVVAREGRSDRIRFVLGRGEQLPFRDATFDAVSFTYLLRYVTDPAAAIDELCRVLAPGGILASIEFGVPAGPVWFPLWFLYTRSVLPRRRMAHGRTRMVATWETSSARRYRTSTAAIPSPGSRTPGGPPASTG